MNTLVAGPGSTLRAARRLLNRQLHFECPDISCGHHRRFIQFNNFGNTSASTSFFSTLSNNNSSAYTAPQTERAEENDSVGSDVLENHCNGSRVEGHALSEVEPVGRRLSDGTMDAYLDSVVKIFTVSSSPNYFLPWQNKSQRESSGSGFVIGGKRVLTNAHVVADHTFVLVRKHGSPTKYRATVQAVGHECDLAILVVQSEEFWEGMNSLELGDVPFLQEAVSVVGYPQGAEFTLCAPEE
ncbi:hypothetical protein RND71_017790 [Anisodus tanguticus]|uniref:Uncharacterized protein n=1 Tax=Anisodus tanguticus TaxID=243964 RepID=A0AAE1S191_9SOLA|nr:hypothetical protein RND71_017790 [Anisodus tanguticus]